MEARDGPQFISSDVVPLIFVKQGLTVFRLGWLTSELQGSFCDSVPRAWTANMYHHSGLSMWSLGVGLKSSCFTN